MAYLRALVNPDDEVSWKRVVNVPKRGVGETSMAKVDSYAKGAEIVFRDALSHAADAFTGQDVEVRLEENVQGSEQFVTYRLQLVKLQKPFASDFDEF